MVELKPVDKRTFRTVVDMKLPPEQSKFVAPNVVSLAQAWLNYDVARPYAICAGETVVGFVMLDWEEDERVVGIWRFMIAPEHQRKGYGRQAMQAVIDMARNAGGFDMVGLDFVEGNTVARELYYSLGFRETGEVEDGEIVMSLPLTDSPKVGMLTADSDDMNDYDKLIESEKASGTKIPAAFGDRAAFERAVAEGRAKHFVVMGETIGYAADAETLLYADKLKYMGEVEAKLKGC